jgi:hypothetical protein
VVHLGGRADRQVRERPAAEQPDVACRRRGDGVIERQGRVGHESVRYGAVQVPWKLIGLGGLAAVAPTGVVVARKRRAHRDYDSEQLRARLRQRLAEVSRRA